MTLLGKWPLRVRVGSGAVFFALGLLQSIQQTNNYWTDLQVAFLPEVSHPIIASEQLFRKFAAEHAICTHDLERTLRADSRTPVTGRSREPALVTRFRACSATITSARSRACRMVGFTIPSRKGAIPRERDWTRGRQRGCSPPPKLADRGGVAWGSTRSRGALISMPGSSADAESGPRAEIMKRSGHGDRTHCIRHLDSISHWPCASTNTQETRCDGWRCRCLFARKTLILDQSPRRLVGGLPVAWTRSY